MKTHPSHETYISMDSSVYDERCSICGATDERGCFKLAEPCPGKRIQVQPSAVCTSCGNECRRTADGRGMYPCDKCQGVPTLVTEQPPPKPADGPDCWKLVLTDMEARRLLGIEKYGQPVLPDNGRDPLVDAYQEALDLCVYLRQAIAKRDGK